MKLCIEHVALHDEIVAQGAVLKAARSKANEHIKLTPLVDDDLPGLTTFVQSPRRLTPPGKSVGMSHSPFPRSLCQPNYPSVT